MQETIRKAIQETFEFAKNWPEKGIVNDFIPTISNIDPDLLSVCLTDMDGNTYLFGDIDYRYTLQSISKAVMLAYCLEHVPEDLLFSRVGVEPCGDHFNDVYRLEKIDRIPSNPFINAGAISMSSCLPGNDVEDKYERFRAFAGSLLGNPGLDYSREVCRCETETAHKNRAIAYMLLDSGVYDGNPDEYLELYYRGCAFLVNTPEVSRLGAVLAADGFDPVTKKQLISAKTSHTVRALIAGCGLYEQTGAYNIAAGIPAKSGSSGVIVAAARKKAGIAVFSPGLDPVGNSVRGLKALSYLSEKLDLRTM